MKEAATGVTVGFASAGLAAELEPVAGARPRRVSQLELAKIALEGDASACRLHLWVDALLLGATPEDQLALRLRLVSTAWAHRDPWPPRQLQAALDPAANVGPASFLSYQISELEPRDLAGHAEGFWHAYLQPGAPVALPGTGTERDEPGDDREEELLQALATWITDTLRADTVGGALRCFQFGDVGYFGALQRRVLERSGAADLEVEATLIAEADDATDPEADPALRLQLYGDRFGAWVLHRRQLQAANRRHPQAPAGAVYQCDVLAADTVQELVDQAGLGIVEKQLFQRAGLLPNEHFHERYRPPAAEEGEEPAAAATAIDMSRIPERSQRYVQAILALAAGGKLNHADMDLLLRVARQIAQGRR